MCFHSLAGDAHLAGDEESAVVVTVFEQECRMRATTDRDSPRVATRYGRAVRNYLEMASR